MQPSDESTVDPNSTVFSDVADEENGDIKESAAEYAGGSKYCYSHKCKCPHLQDAVIKPPELGDGLGETGAYIGTFSNLDTNVIE